MKHNIICNISGLTRLQETLLRLFVLGACKFFICHTWYIHAMGKKHLEGRISYKWISKYVSLGMFGIKDTKLCSEVNGNQNYILNV